MKNFQMQRGDAMGVRHVKIRREVSLRTQHVDDGGVIDRSGGRKVLAIAGGKSVFEPSGELVASLFSQTCNQSVVQVILPAASRLNNSLFDFTDVEDRHASRLSANCDKNAS